MTTNLKRATALLLVIVGLAALTGSKAFKLHANPQACTTAILQGGYGAGTTGLINISSNPNDIKIKTFVPFAEAVYFLFDGHGNPRRTGWLYRVGRFVGYSSLIRQRADNCYDLLDRERDKLRVISPGSLFEIFRCRLAERRQCHPLLRQNEGCRLE